MRTSGKGERDMLMVTVPLVILVVFGVMNGGGMDKILHVIERTLWSVVGAVSAMFS